MTGPARTSLTRTERSAVRSRRHGHIGRWRLVSAFLVAVVTTTTTGVGVTDAGADGASGASSRVTSGGDIVTSIISPPTGRRGSSARRGTSGRPVVQWRTLSPAALDFVLRVAAEDPSLASDPAIDAIRRLATDVEASGSDLQVAFVDGRPTAQVRLVPAPATPDLARAIGRQMVTRLPAPQFRTTPPINRPVPLREPVFVSFDDSTWNTVVDRSITANGITARVRATPIRSVIYSGDPNLVDGHDDSRPTSTECGQGTPFDPGDPSSPSAQSRRPGRCTIVYRTATGVDGRRDRWYGHVTMIWSAQWSIDGGNTWLDLGEIPKLAVMAREVLQFGTRIETSP